MTCTILLICKFVAELIKSRLSVCPWLTRNTLNNELRRRKRLGSQLLLSTNTSHDTNSVIDTAAAAPCTKGGMPAGTTDVKKKNSEMAIIAAKNEIFLQYHSDKNEQIKTIGTRISHRGDFTCEGNEQLG